MVVLVRRVHVLPFTRAPEGRWDADPALDRFLGASRAVCEVLSRELPAAGLAGRRSWSEFYVRSAGQGPAWVEVARSHDAPFGDGNLHIPDSFADLTPPQAARAALGVLDASLRELGRADDWPPEALDDLRARAEETGLRFSWESPWKAAPGRRHEARGVYRLADDGLGRVQLEVRERDGHQTVARTEPAVAGTTAETLRRSAATLRWQDARHVSVVPWLDLAAQQLGHLSVDLNQAQIALSDIPASVTDEGAPYPVLARRVPHGALAYMREGDKQQARVWLQVGGEMFGHRMRGGRVPAAFGRAVEVVRDETDGARWLEDSPFVNIQVQLALDHVDELLAGGTFVFHTAAGDELLTCLAVDVISLHELADDELLHELTSRLRRHLQLVAQRRNLPPAPTPMPMPPT